jgi:hypothetical protein
VTLTEDETEKMAALSTKISAMSAASEDTVQSMGAQVLQEAHEHVATCVSRLVSTDTKSTDSMMQLNQSMQAGLSRMQEAYQTLSTKFSSSQHEAQAVSQVEMEKLQKRLAQIETDLVDKDKQLLDNETQLLTLTEQVEAYQ